jgi:vitamin B12 transporter
MTRIAFYILLVSCVNSTFAQTGDTTYLKEVRVYGIPVTSYATGSKVEQLQSGNDVVTASDKLINETPFYFKTYGNNQLSTIALRGTTASQTAVLWNGININSPTLGQTDFSLIPLFLFDEVSIRYGSASALYGSDAIGGSILIGQREPSFQKNLDATFYQLAGSFGKFNTGIKATYGNERWEFRTKLFRAVIENDFPFYSSAIGHTKTQNHAAVENYGIDQQIHYKISERQRISAEGMYTYNFREIQPAVTNDNADETLLDKHVRLSLNYQNDSRIGILSVTTGYVSSDQDYTNDVVSNVASKQLTALAVVDKSLNLKNNLRYGVSYSHYSASSENFTSSLSEDRYDAFLSFRHALRQFWLINANLRQSFYAGRYAPFAPSLGTEFNPLHQDNNKVTVRAQVARGYRVPTLNDRYWMPGGNPDVLPEDAFHAETGINWSRKNNSWSYALDGTIYKTWIKDMIVWTPEGNVWSPTNLNKVQSSGAEVSAKSTFTSGKYKFRTDLVYSFTRSLNKTEEDPLFNNKQLAYVPLHSGRLFVSLTVNGWSLDTRLNLTGIRYSTLDNEKGQSLDPYALLDASISKRFLLWKTKFDLRAEALNLFDVYYENLKNHAMPGRHYAVSILLNFNNKQTL